MRCLASGPVSRCRAIKTMCSNMLSLLSAFQDYHPSHFLETNGSSEHQDLSCENDGRIPRANRGGSRLSLTEGAISTLGVEVNTNVGSYLTRLHRAPLSVVTSINPSVTFNRSIVQFLRPGTSGSNFKKDNGYWFGLTMVRFVENVIKHKVLYQHTSFLSSSIPLNYKLLYKKWSDRMKSYERNLGHRFFFEESLYLMHLGLSLHDPKIFLRWLSSMVNRISF